jgi:site-specific recombinase XerD
MDADRPNADAWSDLIERFVAWMHEEEKSAHTIRNYRDDLDVFTRWFRARFGEDPEIDRLTKSDLLDWKAAIEKEGGRKDADGNPRAAKLATVNRKLAAVRKFFAWAREHGHGIRFDPPKPRRQHARPKPKSLEADQRRALIRAVESKNSTRDILLIRTGLEAGLRVAELAALLWSDVRISERKGKLTIRQGKGNKQREVDLTKSLRHAFLEHGYERHRGKDRPVFDGQRTDRPLSVRGIQDIIERYAASARVGKRVGLDGCTAHTLRHTCADWLLNEVGLSVPEVAEILGHSDIKTTMIYLAPHKGRLADRMASVEG